MLLCSHYVVIMLSICTIMLNYAQQKFKQISVYYICILSTLLNLMCSSVSFGCTGASEMLLCSLVGYGAVYR